LLTIAGKLARFNNFARSTMTAWIRPTRDIIFTSKVSNVPGNFTCISHPARSKVITNCNKAINAAKHTPGAKRGVTGKVNLTPLWWSQPATAFHVAKRLLTAPF